MYTSHSLDSIIERNAAPLIHLLWSLIREVVRAAATTRIFTDHALFGIMRVNMIPELLFFLDLFREVQQLIAGIHVIFQDIFHT